jgi:hypothetical protein
MKALREIAMVGATIAIGAAPALALATVHPTHPTGPPAHGNAGHQPVTPGPGASLPAKAKAYGMYCKGESKKRVAGQARTPFSRCVTDMAKLARGTTKSPRFACRDESKKHIAGQRGTPFSVCVSAGAKLLKDTSSSGSSTTTTTTASTTNETTTTSTTSSDTTAAP